MMSTELTELRFDPVSAEWVLVSTRRSKRPQATALGETHIDLDQCFFEDPQLHGNETPLLWYVEPKKRKEGTPVALKDWFFQVIPNKYPAVEYHKGACPITKKADIGSIVDGIGFHEVLITRPHDKSVADLKEEEVELIVRGYQERFHQLLAEPCLEYILIFHNHGKDAGASVSHPHSQLIALPVIPADVSRSLVGSRKYFHEHNTCVHCDIVKWEKKQNERIIYENERFIVIAPHASHENYEMRIYPKEHSARFENIATTDRKYFANSLRVTLRALKKALNDPSYNFYLHTAPILRDDVEHYHWHLEILPKTKVRAGIELGTGMELITVSPESASALFRKYC